jgi:hypothetical protein
LTAVRKNLSDVELFPSSPLEPRHPIIGPSPSRPPLSSEPPSHRQGPC